MGDPYGSSQVTKPGFEIVQLHYLLTKFI